MNQQAEELNASDSPIVWFVVLETARKENNFELAARAKAELARLDIIIKYRKPVRKSCAG
jgi:hypothetical protein